MNARNALRRAVLVAACAAAGTLGAAPAALAAKPSSTGGMFVVGDLSAAVGDHVTFWGAQWWKDNSLSGGPAPASFKGFADNVSTELCDGSSWWTRPGDSSFPPATLPDTIPVIVASTVTKSGPVISGDDVTVMLVAPDPGYESNPGHPGTGTIVGSGCGVGNT
jgi:hypothetical protein